MPGHRIRRGAAFSGGGGGGGGSGLSGYPTTDLLLAYDLMTLGEDNIYQDSSFSTAVTSTGDPIGGLRDLHTNNIDPTQGTASSKPTYTASALNGKDCAKGDGGDYLQLDNATATSATSGTIIIGFEAPIESAAVFNMNIDGGGNLIRVETVTDVNDYFQLSIESPADKGTDRNSVDTSFGSFVGGAAYVLTFFSTGTSYGARINGAAETVVTDIDSNLGDGAWAGDLDSGSLDRYTLWATKGGVFNSSAAIGAILVYNSQLTGTDLDDAEGAVADLIGVTL